MIISRIKGEKGFVDIYNKSNGNFELINNIKGIISEMKIELIIQYFYAIWK